MFCADVFHRPWPYCPPFPPCPSLLTPPVRSMVMSFHEHEKWVVNVHLQAGADRRLISGSVMGDVRFWDSRFSQSVNTIQAESGQLSSLSMHDYCPVFATYV